MDTLKRPFRIAIKAGQGFIDDNGFQYSAAVSFYTLFSVAPMVLIMVYSAGLLVGNTSVMTELTTFLEENIGAESARAVVLLVDTIQTDTRNLFFLGFSIVFLIISATTVFIQFKDSFNRILNIKVKAEAGFLKVLLDRISSFALIMLLGGALLLSLAIDSLFVGLSNVITAQIGDGVMLYIGFGSNLVSLFIIFVVLYLVFKVLPDARMPSKPLVIGSLTTTLLLVAGKFGVGLLIGNSSLNQLSGASSSVIILMLWVYYSSIIVFFGIELVKALAESDKREIKAGRYARKIRTVEITSSNKKSDQ